MERSRVPRFRPTLRSSLYVLAVAVSATAGFIVHAPQPILLAALFTLPVSVVALPGYYMAYGFLALIPGANPSSNTTSESFAADGRLLSVVNTGLPAAWFTITTEVLGVLALTIAAVLNVLILRAISNRRRNARALSYPPIPESRR